MPISFPLRVLMQKVIKFTLIWNFHSAYFAAILGDDGKTTRITADFNNNKFLQELPKGVSSSLFDYKEEEYDVHPKDAPV